ncbi:MAG: hypothetical protein SFY95_09765 [Planctomycetota bacterium]|nr:hypothetical protein [Planctomycetota bacterium]
MNRFCVLSFAGVSVVGALQAVYFESSAFAQELASRQEVRAILEVAAVAPPASVDVRFVLTMRPWIESREQTERAVRQAWGDDGKRGGYYEKQLQEEVDRQARYLETPSHTAGRMLWNRDLTSAGFGDAVMTGSTVSGDSPEAPSMEPQYRTVSIAARGDRPAVQRRELLSERRFHSQSEWSKYMVSEWSPVPVGVSTLFSEYLRLSKLPVTPERGITDEMVDLIQKGDKLRIAVTRNVRSSFKTDLADRWEISLSAVADGRPLVVIETKPGDVSRFDRVEMREHSGQAYLIREVQRWREDGWPEAFELTVGADRIAGKAPMQITIESVKADSKPIDLEPYRNPPEGFRDIISGVQAVPSTDRKKR